MTPATPAKPVPAAPAGPTDEWQQMQDLHSSPGRPRPGDFPVQRFPEAPSPGHADDIQKYMEDKFDRLWWDRIEQLFKKTDRLVKDAKDKSRTRSSTRPTRT